MRIEYDQRYEEGPKGTWTHKESGVRIVRIGPEYFRVHIPERAPAEMVGVNAESRAFAVAGLYVEQIHRHSASKEVS